MKRTTPHPKPGDPQPDDHSSDCGPEDIAEPATIIERVMDMIDGKWKVLIVMHLTVQPICRFGELKKKLPRITQRMLTLQLREMESDGLITRRVYPEVPPRVEYALTDIGRDLKRVYMAIHQWGLRHPDALHEPRRLVPSEPPAIRAKAYGAAGAGAPRAPAGAR